MIREMFYHDQKAVPAIYSAKTAMTTGMGVQVDFTKNEVAVPSADDTVDGIFFVDHEFSPEGLKARQKCCFIEILYCQGWQAAKL